MEYYFSSTTAAFVLAFPKLQQCCSFKECTPLPPLPGCWQVEYYFSDSNIPRDKFLRSKIEESEEGCESLLFFLFPFLSFLSVFSPGLAPRCPPLSVTTASGGFS